MKDNTNKRRRQMNPSSTDLDGYDSEEERASILRTKPSWMNPYENPSTIPPDQIYTDMESLSVKTRSPIRYGMLKRHSYIQKFGWANLNKQIIDQIYEFLGNQRVLEVGSGKGLLAYLLQLKGCIVIPTDNGSETRHLPSNRFFSLPEHLDAKDAITKYGSDTLSCDFCPVLIASWSRVDVQHLFAGEKYIYIGESWADASTAGYPDPQLWNYTSYKISHNLGIPECLDESIIFCTRKK
jgi:hypothetical protein